ncbi:lysylphosphatidylglycerol synthase domain-containing protein [Allorhizobium undicola]|uniref:lysylphosphatidylglycerol synthase domain-containing protein n=1 Tax=Allorhizobium undicola TaxID=78527 RepID=UPI003D3427ED
MTVIDKDTQKSFIRRNGVSLIAFFAILAYIAFVQWIWGWASVLVEWRHVGLGTVALALTLLVSTALVRAWRIYDYFPAETRGRYIALFHLAQVHNLLNIMLPFRSGETSFPLLMRSEFAVPLLRATSALLVMRLLDLHALLSAAGLGMVLQRADTAFALLLWLAFLLLPVLAYLLKGRMLAFLRPRLSGKALKLIEEVEAGLPARLGDFLSAWAMTVVNWATKVVVFAWVLSLMGVYPLMAAFGGASGGELSSVLPFHAPAGVGTYPAGIVAGAVAFGASAGGELARAAVNLHIIVIISALTSTVLSLVLSHIRPSRRR